MVAYAAEAARGDHCDSPIEVAAAARLCVPARHGPRFRFRFRFRRPRRHQMVPYAAAAAQSDHCDSPIEVAVAVVAAVVGYLVASVPAP